jgi:hypothetical protein
MTEIRPHLVVYGRDSHALQRLIVADPHIPRLSFAEGSGPEVTRREHLDAILVTAMEAEYLGVPWPLPLGKAVVATRAGNAPEGLPRYIVAGVRIEPAVVRDWRSELKVFIGAAWQAIEEFNSNNNNRIRRVGVLADDLMVRKLDAEEVLRIIGRELE